MKPVLYNGTEYYAEITDDTLTVRRGGDNFLKANAEQEWRKSREAVGQAQRAFDDISAQVTATEEARDRAAGEFERAPIQQRDQAKRILESWELTLEEIRPRLGLAREALETIRKSADMIQPVQVSEPDVFRFDLRESV